MRRMLALTLLVGCKHPAPPPAPPPAPESIPVASAPASASASVPVDATDDEVGLLTSLCDAVWYENDKGEKHIACDAHPPFKKKRAPTVPVPTVKGDASQFCETNAIYRGSFTRAAATEAVLSFYPCYEAGSTGFEGGSAGHESIVLAEKVNGTWREKTYVEGRRGEDCTKAHRAEGRDVLFCKDGFGAFSNGYINYLYVYDFARTQPSSALAWMFANDVNCNYVQMYGSDLKRGSIELSVTPITVADLNHDGNDDATVDVLREHTLWTMAEVAQIKKGCAAEPQSGPPPRTGKSTTTTLEIVSYGDAYTLSPASKVVLERWTRETGENPLGFRSDVRDPTWQ